MDGHDGDQDQGLTPGELSKHDSELLADREEMALISPRPPFPGLPEGAADSVSDVVPSYSIAPDGSEGTGADAE